MFLLGALKKYIRIFLTIDQPPWMCLLRSYFFRADSAVASFAVKSGASSWNLLFKFKCFLLGSHCRIPRLKIQVSFLTPHFSPGLAPHQLIPSLPNGPETSSLLCTPSATIAISWTTVPLLTNVQAWSLPPPSLPSCPVKSQWGLRFEIGLTFLVGLRKSLEAASGAQAWPSPHSPAPLLSSLYFT